MTLYLWQNIMTLLRTFIEFVHSAEIIPHEQLFSW